MALFDNFNRDNEYDEPHATVLPDAQSDTDFGFLPNLNNEHETDDGVQANAEEQLEADTTVAAAEETTVADTATPSTTDDTASAKTSSKRGKRAANLGALTPANIQQIVDIYAQLQTPIGLKVAQAVLDTGAHNVANLTQLIVDGKTQKMLKPFIETVNPLIATNADKASRSLALGLMAGEKNADDLILLLKILRAVKPDTPWATMSKSPRDIAMNIIDNWSDDIDLTVLYTLLVQ